MGEGWPRSRSTEEASNDRGGKGVSNWQAIARETM